MHYLVHFSVNKEGEEGHINQPQQKKKILSWNLKPHPPHKRMFFFG